MPVNVERAFYWFLRAAKRGHDDAAHNVADFYDRGRGVKASRKRAEFWSARVERLKASRATIYR